MQRNADIVCLSMTTDYRTGIGCPEPYLRRIAEAGFTHVHWCHHWGDDFLYAASEIEQIRVWLDELGLGVTDVHGSADGEKCWTSPQEYERLAGVEQVANRIDMAARLGTDVVIMHAASEPDEPIGKNTRRRQLLKSLDALRRVAEPRGVRIAIENLCGPDEFDRIEELLSRYGPEYLGLCYDSGHGHFTGDGLDRLDAVKDRLISVHLHDNDRSNDTHSLPFDGTVDWERFAEIMATSSYDKWVSLEATMKNADTDDEAVFLQRAFGAASRLAAMVERATTTSRSPS